MAEQLTQAQREKRKRDSGRAGYDPALTALSRGAPVMVYDGACNLCHGWVRFALKRDRAERLRFLAAQSPLGQEFLKRNRLPAQAFLHEQEARFATQHQPRLLAQFAGQRVVQQFAGFGAELAKDCA